MFTPMNSLMLLQLGGMLTSGIGAFSSASPQKSALRSQAEIARINARVAETGAQSALAQGDQQVGALTLRAGMLKSAQRAGMAANGIDLSTGSAAEVLASTEIMKEIDKNTTTANAVRNAWGYRTQATNSQIDALMKDATAASISPAMSAATSLLGSAGSVASNWYLMNRLGGSSGGTDGISQLGQLKGWW